jgi:acyl-CoA thioesterase I
MLDGSLPPFWRANTMSESVFFIRRAKHVFADASLLFLPERILAVTSATRETVYEAGGDYRTDLRRGKLRLKAGSRIPFKDELDLYPPMDSDLPKIANRRGSPETGILFGEEGFYHGLQIEVTYTFAPGQWHGYVPAFAGNTLPRTIGKLRRQEPLQLLLVGDSISAGYNASKLSHLPPFAPPYGELVAQGLEQSYGGRVILQNHAVGGWSSPQGLEGIRQQALPAQHPDLVMIAFGMNDAWMSDPAGYQATIAQMMAEFHTGSPESEFILVASMLPNPEWHIPFKQFPAYRDALAELCGPGVVLADLTAVWTELLSRKTFWDITGNGVNHPNDFGHRLYAQTILGLLIPL